MAFLIGPSPGTNFTISSGQTVRHWISWRDFPAGRGTVVLFAAPPNIRTHGNRLVSRSNGVEQSGHVVAYTVDVSCEDVTGTGVGAGYQIGGGGLA